MTKQILEGYKIFHGYHSDANAVAADIEMEIANGYLPHGPLIVKGPDKQEYFHFFQPMMKADLQQIEMNQRAAIQEQARAFSRLAGG